VKIENPERPMSNFYNANMALRFLDIRQLSEVIKKKPATIRTYLLRRPEEIPVPTRIPGTRKLMWREIDVVRWLADRGLEFDPQIVQQLERRKA
jgi:predicted DNA-binding transcriptional regulator AlpA